MASRRVNPKHTTMGGARRCGNRRQRRDVDATRLPHGACLARRRLARERGDAWNLATWKRFSIRAQQPARAVNRQASSMGSASPPSSNVESMEPSPRQSLPGKPLQRSAASQRRFHAHVATIEARHRLTDPVQSPSAPVAIVSASSSANYLHEWSDGSKHRLPEDFQYDNMGCDALWIKWFHGAPKRRIGPYRHFTVDDVKGALNCKYMMRARRVMAELTSIAVATGLAASEDAIAQLRPPECQNVFNAAFAHLEIRQAVGECAKPVRRSSTCKTFIALDQRDRMTRTFEWADGTALHSVPEHWTLPNWSCLNIWLAWFLGDPQSGVRPFRHLYILPNQQQLHLTRQVMAKLVQIALGMQLAASEVDISKLSKWNIQRVYLEAFDILAQRHVPPAECSNINAKKVKVSTLHAILQANNAFCSR